MVPLYFCLCVCVFIVLKSHSFYNIPIFDLEVILLLQCVSTQITQQFRWRRKKLVFKMDFQSACFELFFIYTSTCCFVVYEMFKTDFQYGGCGSHLGFLILPHFYPEVVLLLQSKFQLKSTNGLRKDVKN